MGYKLEINLVDQPQIAYRAGYKLKTPLDQNDLCLRGKCLYGFCDGEAGPSSAQNDYSGALFLRQRNHIAFLFRFFVFTVGLCVFASIECGGNGCTGERQKLSF